MIDEPLLEKARLHVRRWFAKHMPKTMLFHDLEHTLSVTRTAVAIARAMKLPARDVATVEFAALFHDTGYAVDPADHETASARLARAFLRKHGEGQRTIAQVQALILATRLGTVPRTTLQMVLRDADSAKAGQADFADKSRRLRAEIASLTGRKPGVREWLATNYRYLSHHRFYTAHARKRFGAQKRINLAELARTTQLPKRVLGPQAPAKERFHDRDLSWLAFNGRVLQEAKDPRVPLLERIKFLAIYSSNLDEFYRVRVASLRSLAKLNRADRAALDVPPGKLVERINRRALEQQQEFGALYRQQLLPALARKGIRLLRDDQLGAAAKRFVRAHFRERIAPLLRTASVRDGNALFVEDRKLYFVVRLQPRKAKVRGQDKLVLLNIPSEELGRFIVLPAARGRTDLLFLDDAIRLCLDDHFTGYKVQECHAVKLSRDAELHLDEEYVGNVKEKVRKSLKKRRTGVPARFLYHGAMPATTLRALRVLLGLGKDDLVKGGRYHNFSDLFTLPVPGHHDLRDPNWPALQHPAFGPRTDLFGAIAKGDRLLHYPYHDFGQFVRWLRQAAMDPGVQHIAMTLYRVASGSEVCAALLDALRNGKRVTVFVEVQARFDERSNLHWGEELEKAGAKVLYSFEHLKVHCKLCLVERREGRRMRRYAYLGTGNFNERTSRIYADSGLFTADEALTAEVAEVFAHLVDRRHRPQPRHLMMAPLDLRSRTEALIDKEIELALRGRPASILVKLNSLEDRAMIRKLYDASNAGVQVRLILRGICCLVPGVKGMSERIVVRSIVDRYLEHTRALMFGNDGDPLVYLSSADWMGRNLDRRIEVAFPIREPRLRQEVMDLLELQWNDRVKARVIDARQTNAYVERTRGQKALRAQEAIQAYLAERARR